MEHDRQRAKFPKSFGSHGDQEMKNLGAWDHVVGKAKVREGQGAEENEGQGSGAPRSEEAVGTGFARSAVLKLEGEVSDIL